MAKIPTLEALNARRRQAQAKRAAIQKVVAVCGDTGCRAPGSLQVARTLEEEINRQGLGESVIVRVTGCLGFCEQGPVVIIDPDGIVYCRVSPEDAEEIVAVTLGGGEIIERLVYTDPVSGKKLAREADIPFYAAQDRSLLLTNKQIDPNSLDDYIAVGGYSALAKALHEFQPEQIIEQIKASGLRGRGGGGFPTGRKWELCRKAPGEVKFVICNADEGDPGAYMDRSILEGNPHSVLEGMLLGAYAIGARYGYIYVRHEYPLAMEHARLAVEQARTAGLLGQNILGTGFSFDIRIVRGAGAFICGESTALMASIEGRVGEPRPKDVHTVEEGLWNRPSTLNNVETWANIPAIIRNGPKWFAAKGTERSKGTKVFALTGRVRNTGLVEVAMGTPLRTIVFDIGGGAANGSQVKAVQTGGPSGGCLPREMLNLPVDFEALTEAGSMVGSGGIVVMDERTCMVDVAKYFLRFLQDESCGKCVPCRLGITRMLEICTDITEGRGRPEQLELLEELAETVAETSLCALGKTAPNPVLSTLRDFREEYEAHIHERRCPAGVCRALIEYRIDAQKCVGCGACLQACPHGAIQGAKKTPHAISQQLCEKCGVCQDVCKFGAVIVT
ncbi:MAG: NADH-ubiquinone oxidoreductase-F iron-sulfur binding region domain-containing protein [Candidatus Zipacnadales bacterium]